MNLYHYIFYKLYKLIEKPDFSWWSDFRASLAISITQGIFLLLIDFKIDKYTGIGVVMQLGKWPSILIFGCIPIILNHFIFIHNNHYKKIINYYDCIGKKKKTKLNQLLSLIILLFISLIVFLIII